MAHLTVCKHELVRHKRQRTYLLRNRAFGILSTYTILLTLTILFKDQYKTQDLKLPAFIIFMVLVKSIIIHHLYPVKNSMKIAIDASQIIYETGVSVYTHNLIKNLLKIDKKDDFSVLFFSAEGYAADVGELDCVVHKIGQYLNQPVTVG